MNNNLDKKLIGAGMSEAEARVYMTLLTRPSMTAQEVTKISGLPRSTVVMALEKLARLKVVDEYFFGKRRNYVIRSVSAIENYAIEQVRIATAQKADFSKLISDLQNIHFLTSVPGAKIERLNGEDGFKKMYLETLKMKRGENLLIFGVEAEKFMFYPEFLRDYTRLRDERGIRARHILPDSKLGREVVLKEKSSKSLRLTKLLPKATYNPDSQIIICKDKLFFTIWEENLDTVVINSKPVVDILRSLFEIIWENIKK